MKNFKKVFLVAAMAICLGGGIGASVAAITKNAASQTGQGAFDQAINLYWDKESTSVTIAAANEVSVNVPVYRYLTCMPKSTKDVEGDVKLDFTLAAGETNRHVKGVTLEVYKTETLQTDATIEAAITAGTAIKKVTLTDDSKTGNTTFAVAKDSAVHETTAYYAIKLVYDGSNDPSNPTYEMGGSLTIAQSFTAKAA